MGYLNNQTVTVDAILTTKGRELLAKGEQFFKITQFALADDEIDYTLYDVSHPLGSNYYGQLIENMPILEAFPDTDQSMKYKLITLPPNTKYIPQISVVSTNITLTSLQRTAVITPNTTGVLTGNNTLGYTAILSDSTVANLRVDTPSSASPGTTPYFLSDDGTARSISVVGMSFAIDYISQITDKVASIIIIGNETGGRVTITLNVSRDVAYDSALTGADDVQP